MRKKRSHFEENLLRYNLKQQHTYTKRPLKQTYAIINCEKHPVISSFTKIAYIIPVSIAWPERDLRAINLIKTNKRSTLTNETEDIDTDDEVMSL